MNSEAYSNYPEILKKYWFPLALGILGLILFTYGLISLFGSSKTQDDITFSRDDLASKSASLITIDIEGAVTKPGVYQLAEGSIIQDALVLSQGFSEDADRDFVSKNINLALKLTDGSKIYIPRIGEASSQSNSTGLTSQQTGLISINSASETDLDTLPGVGPVTAQKIINNRPYASVDDLISKKVVSSKVFGQIKDKISVY